MSITELPITDAQRYTLSGVWPMEGGIPTATFVVNSQEEWTALWNQRKAITGCATTDPAVTASGAFCASDGPPPVDFGSYTLVIILIWSQLYFDDPTPRSVTKDDDGSLKISYRYIDPSHTPGIINSVGRFFLVPHTTAPVRFSSKECEFSC